MAKLYDLTVLTFRAFSPSCRKNQNELNLCYGSNYWPFDYPSIFFHIPIHYQFQQHINALPNIFTRCSTDLNIRYVISLGHLFSMFLCDDTQLWQITFITHKNDVRNIAVSMILDTWMQIRLINKLLRIKCQQIRIKPSTVLSNTWYWRTM